MNDQVNVGGASAASGARGRDACRLALTSRFRKAKACWEALHQDGAQAVVEAAIVVPVLLVLALAVYNLMVFTAATARFDRVAPDAVVAHGVSPITGGDVRAFDQALDTVAQEIKAGMGAYAVTVEVTGEAGTPGHDALLSFGAPLRTYTCVLRYRPWPSGLSIAGVDLGAPLELSHRRSITVDPWHPGVIV